VEPPSPGADDLRELAQKYRQLAELRARRDRGAKAEAELRHRLRGLSARAPGCLRELDTLGGSELERRAAAAEQAARGGPREPWMAWIWAYHCLMRAALALKRQVGSRPPAAPRARALAAEASALAGFAVDGAFVRAVARPPHGRVGVLVLQRLGVLYGAAPAAIAAALFPVRRPSPYTLP